MRSFFFFKQKTAYEMRISDWSSDVCSSDLVSKEAHDRSPLLANGHSLGEILHSLCGHRRPVAVGQSAVGRGHDDHIAWAQMARLDDARFSGAPTHHRSPGPRALFFSRSRGAVIKPPVRLFPPAPLPTLPARQAETLPL